MRYLRFGIPTLSTAGLLLGLLLVAAPASAQPRQIDPEQACKNDAFRFCNNLIPDRAKVGACLRRNVRALSPDCRTVMGGGARKGTRRHGRHHRRH